MPSARASPLYIEHGWRDGARSLFARHSDSIPPGIASFFGQGAMPLESGRAALTLALRSLPLPRTAKIGVPLYVCTGVFDAIVAAGHIPVFLDIELEHYTVSADSLAKHKRDIDILVAVHTFGHPCDVGVIRDVCGDMHVIEDCAHAMTAEFKGKRVGSFGSAAIYSFRPGKLLGSGGGGMLVLRDPSPGAKSKLGEMSRGWSRGGLFLHYVQAMAGGMLNKSISALDSSGGVSEGQRIRSMAPGDLALLERRLPSLPSIVAAHRRNASLLLGSLDDGPFLLPRASPAVTHDYYLFALRFKSEDDRQKAQTGLQRAGIGAFQLYHIALQRAKDYGYQGGCPNAEIAAKNVLILPVHPGVSEAAIRTMIDRLSHFRDGSR